MKVTRQFPKLLAVGLVLTMTLASLSGCKKEEQAPAGTVSDFESQTHIQVSAPAASTSGETSENTSKAPLTGEFVVSEKKYDYKDANLELLYVENQTNRHCNVTIHGKYLDENGETIREETQTFEAFPAGWSNHFIFYPRTAFDSFTYTVDTEEYVPETMHADESGTPYASYLELSHEKDLEWVRGIDDDSKEVRELLFHPTTINHHATKTIGYEYHLLILDTNGEIYLADYDHRDSVGVSGGWHDQVDPVGAEEGVRSCLVKQQEVGEDETIPDTVQGVFTAIFAVMNVYDYEEWLRTVVG